MQDAKIQKLVRAALLAALCLVMTRVVTVPAPTGYVNLGDCAVLLAAWMLGPLYGGLAAGVGAALADVLSGFATYAPGTFAIKLAMGVTAALIFRHLEGRAPFAAHLLGAVTAEGLMTAGYFAYESLVLGVGLAAVASVPANLVQGVFGIAAGLALISALEKSGLTALRG